MLGAITGHLVSQQHTSAAGGHDLVAVEAQRADTTERAGMTALVVAAERFGRVLDKHQPPALTDGDQCVEVDRVTEGVHRQAGTDATVTVAGAAVSGIVDHRVLGQPFLQGLRREAQRVPVHIDEEWLRAAVGDCVAGRHECERLRDDEIALVDANQFQRNVQRRRAIHHCDGARATGEGRHVALEPVDIGTDAGHERRIDRVQHQFPLAPTEDWRVQRNKLLRTVLLANKTYQTVEHC